MSPETISTTNSLQEAWFQPMGFMLHLASNSAAIMQAGETSFRGFGPGRPTRSPDFSFRLFEHDIDDGAPGPAIFRKEGHLLYQSTGRDSTLVADLITGTAIGYFSGPTLANEAFFRWHFLELALFQMLEAQGLMGVHGAALVKNNKAVLLRAPSGGGKSTLAFAGARARFKALAEDVVWLDGRRNLWWGMPWSVHLLPDATLLFPELGSYVPALQINGELKLEVNPEKIRPGGTAVSASPGPVVLVERVVNKESRLENISQAEAFRMWHAARTGLEMELPHHAPYIETLLQSDTYRLYSGNDIESSLTLLETLFDE